MKENKNNIEKIEFMVESKQCMLNCFIYHSPYYPF